MHLDADRCDVVDSRYEMVDPLRRTEHRRSGHGHRQLSCALKRAARSGTSRAVDDPITAMLFQWLRETLPGRGLRVLGGAASAVGAPGIVAAIRSRRHRMRRSRAAVDPDLPP